MPAAPAEIELQFGRGVSVAPLTGDDLAALARAAAGRGWRLTLRFAPNAEARALNRRFRRRGYVPNVLTFAYPEIRSADIVICTPVVREQARRQGKSYAAHLAHMVVHGALHAIGHTHDHDADARRMEARERRLLARFGIGDPYAAGPRPAGR